MLPCIPVNKDFHFVVRTALDILRVT